ncbi:MAG TPA: PBP1A family penicillin-binding protein [Patescibacteria group bacterium]|nr:PBP1A family penicillin-binding protein [Patescibacteria group bacterium]
MDNAANQRGSRPGGRRRTRRWLLLAPLGLAVVLAGAMTVAFLDANWRFARHGPPAPVRVESLAFPLREGTPLTPGDLVERLTRLGYRKVEGHPATPGEYARRFRGWEIALNRFEGPHGTVPERLVRVRIGSDGIHAVEDLATGQDVVDAALEPEPLGLLSGGAHEERAPIRLDETPAALRQAVIAVEDRRFAQHPGIDLRGVARALMANLHEGEVVQGGSTITQQLAKNLYQDQESRTLTLKVWESLAAIALELAHSKDEILERYLNEIYLAQRGPYAILGVGAASRHYFGKEARYLDLPESALLAGLIQSPGRYHPYRHPDAAVDRRNLVLRLMREEGFISAAEERAAATTPLRLRPEPSHDPRQAPYFVDYVAEVLKNAGVLEGNAGGLRVFTTLDPLLQERAETALEKRLADDERAYRHLRPLPGGAIEGAVVALRPSDGAILAMVGGRDYRQTQFNRAAQAHRQPGSLFKPFVYLAGFALSQRESDSRFTPATVLDDSPLEMVVSGKVWSPHDFDEQYRGPVTARQALANSLNVPTIRVAQDIGLNEVVRTARRCGIESPLEPVPSLALGTFEVTPLEIASAYTTFANLGARVGPRAIDAILDEQGHPIDVPPPAAGRAATPQAAWLTLDLMRDVLRYGTGASVGAWSLTGDFAGKTGTTDDGRDAWFAGFSPDFLALVWVGFDNNRPLRMGGSVLALPIWADLARGAGINGDLKWEEPEGLVRAEIDPTTGKLAGWHCPDKVDETFIEGSAPTEECEHNRPFVSWARRLLNWFRRE